LNEPIVDIDRFIRGDSGRLPAYEAVPSVDELALRYGIATSDLVRLDSNENPYGPSAAVREAMLCVAAERYPDSQSLRLRAALAEYSGVPDDQIVAGNGADEIIDLLFRVLLDPGDEVAICPPTFSVYRTTALLNRGRVVEMRRDSRYAVDVDAVKNSVGPRTKLIVVCSPNNPTGNVTERSDIVRLLNLGVPLLLDEAYVEFSSGSAVDLVGTYPNLVIVRTMSKWSALAGLRLGYGIMTEVLARRLLAIKPAFNVNAAAEAAALASLADIESVLVNVERLREGRACLQRDLAACPFLEIFPTSANFVYCQVRGATAQWVGEELMRRGIAIRVFADPAALRITVGTREQNERLMEALGEIGCGIPDLSDINAT